MAGIQDVQPKQISSLGQPMVGEIQPAATTDAVAKLTDAYKQGFITADDISQRMANEPVLQAQRQVALQQAKETMSPEAIQAREEARRLEGQKSLVERKSMLSKDFVGAYLKYNLPLTKADGSYDIEGMAEVGQKYADMERRMQFAQMGLTPHPVESVNEKGQKVTRFFNQFGEDITPIPGKVNPVVAEYQKIMRGSRSFLLQNDNEPSKKPGDLPNRVEVHPKTEADVFGGGYDTRNASFLTPPVSPLENKDLATYDRTPTGPLVEPLASESTGVFPVVTSATPAGLAPEIQTPPPAGPKVTIESPGTGHQVVIEPKTQPAPAEVPPTIYAGEGLVTGPGTFDKDKFLQDQRATGLYKNWEEKAPVIGNFRNTVAAYNRMKPGEVTSQMDTDLANAALQITAPGTSVGGRGMEGYRIERIEKTSIPLIEQALNIKGLVLKEHKFPKETRDRIIAATEAKARTLEEQGRSVIQSASERLKNQGYDPSGLLFAPEKQLLQGTPAAGQQAGRTITLSSGRRVTLR